MSKVFKWALAPWVSYGSFNGNSFTVLDCIGSVLDCIGYTLSFPVMVWGNQSKRLQNWRMRNPFYCILTISKDLLSHFIFIPAMSHQRKTHQNVPKRPQRSVSPSRRYQQLPPAGGLTGFPLKTTVVVFRLRLIIIHPWSHRNHTIIQCHFKMHSITYVEIRKCVWVLAPFHELIKLNLSQHKKND